MNTINQQVDVIICVCCKKDGETWGIASEYIVKNIQAHSYRVYVPDCEVSYFKDITAQPFEVISELIYSKEIAPLIRQLLPNNRQSQFGWYLQQFIKIAAVNACKPNEIALIWDADTVPIKKLQFIDSQGRLSYYKGEEFHIPYFDFIYKLTGMKKIVSFSFIAQCFIARASWAQDFLRMIEEGFNEPWAQVLLVNINFNEGNGFSEYEMLGTYISHRHASEVQYIDRQWYRFGNSLIGHVAFLTPGKIRTTLKDFDFISFEKWDRMKPHFLCVKIPYFFQIYLKNVFLRLLGDVKNT